MLKGISIWALKGNTERPAASLFEEAHRHGFDGVEPAVGEEGLLTPRSSEEDCAELLEAAERAGVRLTSLASGLGWQYPLTADDESIRQRGVEVILRSVHLAAWLGLDTLLVVPGMLAPPGADGNEHVPYDVAMQRMREGIARIVPTAEEAGVTLGIENVWNRLLLSPLEMRDFIDGFGSVRVGSYFDVGNVIAFGYPEDWIRILGPRVSCVHFKDFKRSVGTLEGFCPLTEGDVAWPAVMESLRQVGYDGPCVAEFFGLDHDALAELSEAMDRILAV